MGEIRRPAHNLTEEAQAQIETALQQRDQIDYECFLRLKELLPHVNVSDPAVRRAVDAAEQLLKRRDKANRAFVVALVGRRLPDLSWRSGISQCSEPFQPGTIERV